MKIYQVGGAIRGKLLNLPIKDIDWVVVGSTPEEMISLGFKLVGKDFPVFIDPITKQEYALARTEKKQGFGYRGFNIYTSPNVTLEEDLSRRDLTINAMAMDEAGEIIDPFQGQMDLKNKLLRPVSPAFKEDPLRAIRAARFRAKFNFSFANDLKLYVHEMKTKKEFSYLSVERLQIELIKSLKGNPILFLSALSELEILETLYSELQPILSDDFYKKSFSLQSLDELNILCFLLHRIPNSTLFHQFVKRFQFSNQWSHFLIIFYENHKALLNLIDQKSMELNSVYSVLEQFNVFKNTSSFLEHLNLLKIIYDLSEEKIVLLTQIYSLLKLPLPKEVISNCKNSFEISEAIKNFRLKKIQSLLEASS